MFCRLCGAKIPEGANACPKCGTHATLGRRVEQIEKAPEKKEELPHEEIKMPTLYSREKKPKGILDKRKRKYLERRGLEPKPEVEEEAEKRLTAEKPEDSFPSADEEPDIDISKVKEEELDLSGIDLSKLEEMGGIAKQKKVSMSKTVTCKNCNSLKGKIIYCPHCGKQFCSDCASQAEKKEGMVFYQCPFCKKQVILQ